MAAALCRRFADYMIGQNLLLDGGGSGRPWDRGRLNDVDSLPPRQRPSPSSAGRYLESATF